MFTKKHCITIYTYMLTTRWITKRLHYYVPARSTGRQNWPNEVAKNLSFFFNCLNTRAGQKTSLERMYLYLALRNCSAFSLPLTPTDFLRGTHHKGDIYSFVGLASPSPCRYHSVLCVVSHRPTIVSMPRSPLNLWPLRYVFCFSTLDRRQSLCIRTDLYAGFSKLQTVT
jgi:hypothetical protein